MTNEKGQIDSRVEKISEAVLLALAASLARQSLHIDRDTVLRVVIGINGLMIAYYGNSRPR